jgi:hypothetical protein
MVFFEEGSSNKNIHEALRAAERVRKVLREEKAEKVASRAPPAEQTGDTDSDSAPTISQRRIDRRSFSSGRAE